MDTITTQRLTEIHPVLASRVVSLISDCENVAIYLRVTQGLRSPNLQHALFIQGRQPIDVVNEARAAVKLAAITEDQNKEVTNADYLDSMHCYGLAVDVDPSEDSVMTPFNPDWDTQDAQWQKVLEIAKTHQLNEGALWTGTKRDYPHLYPIELEANPTDEMKQVFRDAGLKAVWDSLNLSA